MPDGEHEATLSTLGSKVEEIEYFIETIYESRIQDLESKLEGLETQVRWLERQV